MPKAKTQKQIQKKHVISTNFEKHQYRKAYDPRERVQFKTTDSLTEKSHVDECDINKILAQYIKTGTFNAELLEKHNKVYGDFSGHDFEKAQNQIARAQTLFEELPSIVRKRFNNSPAQFLDFAGDENNMQEMVDMGLANAPKREDLTEKKEATPPPKSPEEGDEKQLST